MTPDRIRWLLEHPLDYADGGPIPAAYIDHRVERDGSILTATLAVDR